MNDPETVAGYLDKLTHREQLILCNCIREHIDDQRYAHLTPALLPFVRLDVAVSALKEVRARRPIAALYSKLDTERPFTHYAWLSSKKVAKVFGAYPERGRRFNWLPKRFSNGRPIDPIVRLTVDQRYKPRPGGTLAYRIITHPTYEAAVMMWLCDNLT